MPGISIKQNKKGTFLDLSAEDILNENFVDEFSSFANDKAGFLSGNSVSLIVPEAANEEGNKSILDQVKDQLNKNNISLKSIMTSDESLVATSVESTEPLKEEHQTESGREVIDTSELPETLYIEANLRSGQMVRYPGNVFVLGDVNPSAEIVAAGDIIIWGHLRGIAHAGANGDRNAKIIALEISSGQIRIADEISALKAEAKGEKTARDIINKIINKGQNDTNNYNKIPVLAKIRNNEIIISRYF